MVIKILFQNYFFLMKMGKEMRIVIVDNIDKDIALLKYELEQIAQISEVVIADNETEALNLARDEYELFILNTGIDGIDEHFIEYCIKKFKQIIIHTSIDDEEIMEQMSEHKIIDYIVKSIPKKDENILKNRDRITDSSNFIISTINRIIDNVTRNILFYSNEQDKKEVIQHIESQNFNLIEAKTIENLIFFLENNKIDILLLDFIKLNYDDLELVKEIRKTYPKDKLSIIMLQYFSNKKIILTNFLKAGVNFIIYKPYLKEELVNTLNNSFKNLNDCYLIDLETGLYKFDFFAESGQKILNSAVRENKAISLAIVEIDNLSLITQDDTSLIRQLISHLATILIHSLRTGDIICEYNNHKIAILMPNTASDNALIVIDRIRQKIKQLPYAINEKKSVSFTISGGVAGKGGYDLNTMLDMSDDYLYRAKKYGMDRIESL